MREILASRLAEYEERVSSERDPLERDVLRHRMQKLAQGEDEPEEVEDEPVEDIEEEEPAIELAPEPDLDVDDTIVDEQLQRIEDNLEEISETLRSHEEILHEISMDEASPAEIDEAVKEQKKQLVDDDIVTGEEFGLSTHSFYGHKSRTRSNPMGNLREARMRRLAEAKKPAAKPGVSRKAQSHDVPENPATTLRDHWRSEEQRDDLRSDQVPYQELYNPASEMESRTKEERGKTPRMWQDTFNPKGSALKKLSVQLIGEGAEKTWFVLRSDTDEKIARIDCPEGVAAEKYAARSYGINILNAIHKRGFGEAMDGFGAVPVKEDAKPAQPDAEAPPAETPAVEKSAATRCAKHDVEDCPECPKDSKAAMYASQEFQAAVERAVVNHMARLKRVSRIAIMAASRNLIHSPLKAAFHEVLQSVADIENPVPLIERAFRMAGEKHDEALMAQAEEWMSMDDKALAEWERTVRRANTIMPPVADEGDVAARSVEAHRMRLRAAAGSAVPTTEGMGMDEQGSDLAARLAAAVPKPEALWNRQKLTAALARRA